MILHTILGKLFRIREDAHQRRLPKGADDGFDPDEKPFLDHLEDLRVMFMKIIITLVVVMIGCFAFRNDILDAMRMPMVWAQVGNPDALSIIINRDKNKEKKSEPRFQQDETVFLESGIVGKFKGGVEDDSNLATIEIADGLTVTVREQSIAGTYGESLLKKDKKKDKAEKLASTFNYDQLLVMETFTPYEALVLTLKLAFFAGVVLAFPLLIWYVAEFVLPGLRQTEKKVIFPALAVGFFLFLVGAAFAYRVGLPFALRFLAEFTLDAGIKPGWRIGYYIKFVTQVILVFGLCFELPVAVMAMVKMELLTFRTMRDSRSYAIVILLCIAAIFTPPDPMTLLLLGGPLILLYEMCIWLAWFIERGKLREEAKLERERAERRAQAQAASPDEMTEEEKREAAADEIARYEAGGYADDPHHDEQGNYIGSEHDPYHPEDWDHDHHGHDAMGGMGIIDINHATLEELQQLPGVGPTLAERIIEGRPYYSEEELEYHAHLPESVIRLIVDRIYYG